MTVGSKLAELSARTGTAYDGIFAEALRLLSFSLQPNSLDSVFQKGASSSVEGPVK